MNNITKFVNVKSLQPNDDELAKINENTLKNLTSEEIYIFKLILCSNEIDRDFESFTIPTLNQLSIMFCGKSLIFDHNRTAKNQVARIYDTSIMTDSSKKTKLGEDYTYVEAKVYMLNTQKNADLISEIDAGIKKEVSVSLRIKSKKCSICGVEFFGYSNNLPCGHEIKNEYDGKICCKRLDEAIDAYEVSFVAVPAQIDAKTKKEFENEIEEKAKENAEENTEEKPKNTLIKTLGKFLLKNMEE